MIHVPGHCAYLDVDPGPRARQHDCTTSTYLTIAFLRVLIKSIGDGAGVTLHIYYQRSRDVTTIYCK